MHFICFSHYINKQMVSERVVTIWTCGFEGDLYPHKRRRRLWFMRTDTSTDQWRRRI